MIRRFVRWLAAVYKLLLRKILFGMISKQNGALES